jgi:hypothetical protein
MRVRWSENVFHLMVRSRSERVTIYLPADETHPNEMKAYMTVMAHLAAEDYPLAVTGYSAQVVTGGFRVSVTDEVEIDITRKLMIENWKPIKMRREEFLLELDRLKHFIAGAYACAGCPQTKILITIEPGAEEIT